MSKNRLTKSVRAALIESVLKDQFADDFKALSNKLKEQVNNAVCEDYAKQISDYSAMAEKAKELGYDAKDVIRTRDYAVLRQTVELVDSTGKVIEKRIDPFDRCEKGAMFGADYKLFRENKLKEAQIPVDVPATFYNQSETRHKVLRDSICPYSTYDIHVSLEDHPEIAESLQEFVALKQQMYDMYDSLLAVIMSVGTITKLKELTHVFNPFIVEASPTKTAMLPVEAIDKVNQIKSPKTKAA